MSAVTLRRFHMQLSARNQLKGKVKSVKTDGLMAEVTVDIGGNELVLSLPRPEKLKGPAGEGEPLGIT
jgi:ABC-type molybdate transport system ATPase subunit